MKTTNALALSALLVNSLVAAYPSKRHEHLHKKRDLVVVTEDVFETVYSTTTIWVDPTSAGGEFYEQPAHTSTAVTYEIVPSAVTSAEAASSTAQYVAPSSSSVYVAPSSVESPAPSSSTPAVSSSSVYVAPSSAYVAPSSTEATSSAAASTPRASTASTGNTYSGDVTYYNPAGGYGACGSTLVDSDHVVAIAHALWDTKGTMSNGNPWCGVSINILNEVTGNTYTATIADKCMGCSGGDLDLPQGFFDEAFPGVDGRGKGVMSWSVAA